MSHESYTFGLAKIYCRNVKYSKPLLLVVLMGPCSYCRVTVNEIPLPSLLGFSLVVGLQLSDLTWQNSSYFTHNNKNKCLGPMELR